MKAHLLFAIGLLSFAQPTFGQSALTCFGPSLTLSDGQCAEVIPADTLRRIGRNAYSTVTGRAYRFGFQGQEKDDEKHGDVGTSCRQECRIEVSRTGRFLSIDPLAVQYPHNSPYAFSENRVIDGVDLEGLEWAPHPYNLSEAEYESELVRPEIKVADAWFIVNQIENDAGMILIYNPNDSRSFAGYDPEYGFINVRDRFFDAQHSPGGRIGILHHEEQHRIHFKSNSYPGAFSFIRIPTDKFYYMPYSKSDIEDSKLFHIPLDPLGDKNFFDYTTSNAVLEHRDVYLTQLAGHTTGLYTLTDEEMQDVSTKALIFDKRYKLALEYEKENNLNPDGTSKQ